MAFPCAFISVAALILSIVNATPIEFASPREDVVVAVDHPRLLLPNTTLVQNLRKNLESDDTAKLWFGYLKDMGEELINTPPIRKPFNVSTTSGLLDQARDCLNRTYILAMLHQFDSSETPNKLPTKWATRGIEELVSIAGWNLTIGWNPSHFLDVGEFSHAYGIGYDWFYDVMSDYERTVVSGVLVRQGLEIGLKAYKENAWWSKDYCNWNIVCNGGLAIGAMAIGNDTGNSSLVNDIIQNALTGLPYSFGSYATDGAWPEGPTYWGYATRYAIVTISALESALGSDFGLASTPGFSKTCEFAVTSLDSTQHMFDWADADDAMSSNTIKNYMWLANRFNLPYCAYAARIHVYKEGFEADDLLYYNPSGTAADLEALPKARTFDMNIVDTVRESDEGPAVRKSLGFFRTGWTSNNDTFLGFKGGDNYANHNHLDQGSFVITSQGIRWARDPGADNYGLPGYFSKNAQRYHYYRLNNRGHNTYTFGNMSQDRHGVGEITAFDNTKLTATVNVTGSYPHADLVERNFQMDPATGRIIISDNLSLEKLVGQNLTWTFQTKAGITLLSSTHAQLLAKPGHQIYHVQIDPTATQCPGLSFAVDNITLDPPARNPRSFSALVANAPNASACTHVKVITGDTPTSFTIE